jgi:hypothetical protein
VAKDNFLAVAQKFLQPYLTMLAAARILFPTRTQRKNTACAVFFLWVRPAGNDPATFSLKGSCSTS